MISLLKYIQKTIFIYAIYAWVNSVEAAALTAPQLKAAGAELVVPGLYNIQSAPLIGNTNLVKTGSGKLNGTPYNRTGSLSILEGILNINRSYPGPTSLSIATPLAIGFSPASAGQLEATDIALANFNALQLVPYDPSGLDGIINIAIGSYRYPIIAADASSVQNITLVVPDIAGLDFQITPNTGNPQWRDVVITTTANLAIDTSAVIFKTIFIGQNQTGPNLEQLNQASQAGIDAANAVIATVGAGISTTASKMRNSSEELRLKLQALDKLPTRQKFEAMLEAVARETTEPVVFTSADEQMRTWVMPYATYGKADRSQFSQGNHRRTAGSLVGIEHRNLKEGWAIGVFTGLVYTHEKPLGDHLSYDHSKGYHAGIYGTYKPQEWIRFESMLFVTSLKHKQQRYGNEPLVGEFLAMADYKQFDIVADNHVRFIHNIDECWSVSTNLGYTYFKSTTDKYSEYNVSMVGINQPTIVATSGEVYTGLGVRYNHQDEEYRYGSIVTYEIGKEARKDSNKTSGSTQNGFSFLINPTNRKRTTRYFNFLSYFEGADKIKYILKYSNISAAHDLTHNLMLKVEWKF